MADAPMKIPGRKRLSPVGIILMAMLSALAIRAFFVDLVSVRGDSMRPTAKPGTLALVAPSAYGLPNPLGSGYLVRWADPAPGDLVILRAVGSAVGSAVGWNRIAALKRVLEVGPAFMRVEGGSLVGRYGSVRLDPSARLRFVGAVYVAGGMAFVVGDNAGASYDSRDYGAVPIENIRAKVLLLLGR